MVRRVAVVTGSRADYGLLRPVMRALDEARDFELQVLVTGMHLEDRFDETWKHIEEDGFTLAARIPMELTSDQPETIARSMGLGTTGTVRALEDLTPDLLLVLGDRFEILAAVQAALLCGIPVAHLAGGDVTVGAMDESIRHSISKMSHLHFPTHREAADRLRQLGEDPAHIFCVGSPGLDTLLGLQLLDREALGEALNFPLRSRNLLITYHPETLDEVSPSVRLEALLAAVGALGEDVGLLFTMPNADQGGQALFEGIEAFTRDREHAKAWVSMGQMRYLSAMKHVDAVVGNSSSGLYEAPSLATPTVNIGGRQDGRPRASSVIDCAPDRGAISSALDVAWSLDCASAVNPFGNGQAAPQILEALRTIPGCSSLLRKRFFDLGGSS